jgi:hypothetical protein
MIEATGLLTLVTDEKSSDQKRPRVAVPDVVSEWSDPSDGLLYRKLLELLGQDVYVLVLPKAEMLQVCECDHTRAEHLEFENWGADGVGVSGPSLDSSRRHLSYAGYHPADDIYCKCTEFRLASKKEG